MVFPGIFSSRLNILKASRRCGVFWHAAARLTHECWAKLRGGGVYLCNKRWGESFSYHTNFLSAWRLSYSSFRSVFPFLLSSLCCAASSIRYPPFMMGVTMTTVSQCSRSERARNEGTAMQTKRKENKGWGKDEKGPAERRERWGGAEDEEKYKRSLTEQGIQNSLWQRRRRRYGTIKTSKFLTDISVELKISLNVKRFD